MPSSAKCFAPALQELLLASLPLSAGSPAPLAPSLTIPTEAARNVHFGLPGTASADPKDRERYLIARPQYVLSFHTDKRIPNWASWNLLATDIGDLARSPFQQDPHLPRGFCQVTGNVDNGGGVDRGHLCPDKDSFATPTDSRAVFCITNIVPQSPASNQRDWEWLEDYCCRLDREGNALHIACGPAGVGGLGKNGPADRIGKGRVKVTVPAKPWKLVLVLPREDTEPPKHSRVIAVTLPNDQTVDFNWAEYRVTTRDVARLTGLRFLTTAAEEVAEALGQDPHDPHR
jgi:endonuclease G